MTLLNPPDGTWRDTLNDLAERLAELQRALSAAAEPDARDRPDPPAPTRLDDDRKVVISPGRERCEAGVPFRDGRRCVRQARLGERWCSNHHPNPEQRRSATAKPRASDLRYRPDGPVLTAMYELTDIVAAVGDRITALETQMTATLQRLDEAEQRRSQDDNALWDVRRCSRELAISEASLRRLVQERRVPFVRVLPGAIRFDPEAVARWLAERMQKPVV